MSFATQSLNAVCVILAVASVSFLVNNKRLEEAISLLEDEAAQLKNALGKIHQTCKHEVVSAFPRIPPTHIVSHEEKELNGLNIEQNVTFILLYDNGNTNKNRKYFKRQLDAILCSFPKAKVLYIVYGSTLKKALTQRSSAKMIGFFKTEAEGINMAIGNVTTPYFLLLQSDMVFELRGSDGSLEWLHHALVITPGFDIIGGSMLLSNNELVIPCYSINLCNWTMTQNYEYRRSYGEVMICDEVSYSFMARTEIVKKFTQPLFDKNIKGFLYTDFFLQAKRLGLTTANRPEVMFLQAESQDNIILSPAQLMDAALPFARKHQILRFKDPDKKITSICESSDVSICSVENMVKNWKLPKWYESGTFAYPFVIEQAIKTLDVIGKKLSDSGIQFALRGETLFGAVMTKSVLPWGKLEAIHLWIFKPKEEIITFASTNGFKYSIQDNTITLMVKTEFPSSMKVELVSTKKDTKFANILVNGKFYPTMEDPTVEMKEVYGDNYLEGLDSKAGKFSCELKGHHACLPDMKTRGANTYKEKYCSI